MDGSNFDIIDHRDFVCDPRFPTVNDADYKPPFALTSKLNKLTIRIDRPQLSPADIAKLQAAMKAKGK